MVHATMHKIPTYKICWKEIELKLYIANTPPHHICTKSQQTKFVHRKISERKLNSYCINIKWTHNAQYAQNLNKQNMCTGNLLKRNWNQAVQIQIRIRISTDRICALAKYLKRNTNLTRKYNTPSLFMLCKSLIWGQY